MYKKENKTEKQAGSAHRRRPATWTATPGRCRASTAHLLVRY